MNHLKPINLKGPEEETVLEPDLFGLANSGGNNPCSVFYACGVYAGMGPTNCTSPCSSWASNTWCDGNCCGSSIGYGCDEITCGCYIGAHDHPDFPPFWEVQWDEIDL